jgi:proteasome lid subunit RPN8/RPN11
LHRRLETRLLAEARKAHPEEACGLLLGRFGRIWAIRPTRNVHPAPRTHFEIDPRALIAAHRTERAGGLKLLGYYHSHPAGEPIPSATDRALSARDGKIWAIVAGKSLMFWKDDPAGFVPLFHMLPGR